MKSNKVFVFLLIAIIVFSLVACNKPGDLNDPRPSESSREAEDSKLEPKTEPVGDPTEKPTEVPTEKPSSEVDDHTIVIGKPIQIGRFEVVITELKVVSTLVEKDALRITYDFTNTEGKDKDETRPIFTVRFKAFQNGVETEEFVLSLQVDLTKILTSVKPGEQIIGVQDAVSIDDMNAPLLLELSLYGDDEVYSLEINDLNEYK
ncbi:MAG TPA: DUF5067 domain-containing protein [Clostridiaceae bacterium]|nr:DUF5067 domain-containing protein [Clostridiaceae bacterium]